MTDDQRRSRGALEGDTPGLATVHDLFSGRGAGISAAGNRSPGGKGNDSGKHQPEAPSVVSLDGTRLNQHDLSELIAQKDPPGETGDESSDPPRSPEELTEDAREILLKQLAAGPRTRAQLARTLAQKEIPDEVASAVLDRFEEVDLVDDAAFSRRYVENRHSGRGLARRALAYELRQKGVADETVREAVDSVSPDDELATARQLVRKKAASMTKDDPERRMRRLAGMLARKGYGSGVAYQAIREELADLDAEGLFGPRDFD